ncbi:paired amphipathic helix protein Sin3a [Enteropsectra breve]|nr:paired amphipathic helix protein Sin3a [Enteropsectra breve]
MPSDPEDSLSSNKESRERITQDSASEDNYEAKDESEYGDMNRASMHFISPDGQDSVGMPRPGDDTVRFEQSTASANRSIFPEDSDLTDAMAFLNRIKKEYADRMPVYDDFLETMRDFKFGKINAEEVCKAVRILFKDKVWLIHSFDEYLPHHLRFHDGRGFDYMPNERVPFPSYFQQPFPSHNTPMYGNMMHPGANAAHSRSVPSPGIPQRQPFAPSSAVPAQRFSRAPSSQDHDIQKHRLANEFIHLVKKKYFNHPIVYRQFVELLKNTSNSFEKLLAQVSILLSDSPELIEKFIKNFRPSDAPETVLVANEDDPLRLIKEKLAEKDVLEDFVRALNLFNQNYISAEDLIFMLDPIIKDDENMAALKTFLKYEDRVLEPAAKNISECKKIGSYRVFGSRLNLSMNSSLSKEVLNDSCMSVSILDSEEDFYVFRVKNSSEELLTKIGDERSESDLHLGRLKYLIGKLEELYSELNVHELEMEDIEMSAALVKETLRCIYDQKYCEVLEALLNNPKKSIPVVLKRLQSVYKENLARSRQNKNNWCKMVGAHYYKAYDTNGVLYRHDEKNQLALKYIYSESDKKLSIKFNDLKVIDLIKNLYFTFVENNLPTRYKKTSPEKQKEYFEKALAFLLDNSLESVVDFDQYALNYFILMLYVRFVEIKKLHLAPFDYNEMAVELGAVEKEELLDRHEDIVKTSFELMDKTIDAEVYEEKIRLLTDSRGYKLYNLKKIMTRICKQVCAIAGNGSDSEENDESDPIFSRKFCIKKRNGTIEIAPARDEERVSSK